MNEQFFLAQTCFIALTALAALRLGKEALISFVCLMCLLANIFVAKQITLFGLHVTPTDSLSIGASLGLNLLQEYYGRPITKKTIWLSFAAGIVFTVLCQFHLFYTPSIFDTTHEHYRAIFGLIPRIMAASFATYILVQHIESILYAFLQKLLPGQLLMRNFCSVGICQLLDTVLFSFLGLYGSVENIFDIILLSYTIKLIVLGLATPFLWFCKNIITTQRVEIS